MKRSALLVGGFVLGALVLVVIGILWLSGNSLFERQQRAIVYFNGGVAGLYVGAPVTFRGVAVGQVESINVEVDETTLAARIAAGVRLSPNAVRFGNGKNADEPAVEVATLVQRGLRAKLVAQSFVTGQKLIDLDFVADAPPVAQESNARPEIPVIADRFDALVDQLAEVPLRDTVQDLRKALQALTGTLDVTRTALAAGGSELAGTAAEARKTMQVATATLEAASQTLRHVQRSADQSLASVTRLADTARDAVVTAQPELQRSLVTAREATEAARLAMNRVAELAAPGAPLRSDLDTAMRDLSQAARGLRDWSELLEEQPNAVIFGNRQR